MRTSLSGRRTASNPSSTNSAGRFSRAVSNQPWIKPFDAEID